jgi:hypothetical protein
MKRGKKGVRKQKKKKKWGKKSKVLSPADTSF